MVILVTFVHLSQASKSLKFPIALLEGQTMVTRVIILHPALLARLAVVVDSVATNALIEAAAVPHSDSRASDGTLSQKSTPQDLA